VSVPGKEPFVKTIELTKGTERLYIHLLWTELMPEMFCMGFEPGRPGKFNGLGCHEKIPVEKF